MDALVQTENHLDAGTGVLGNAAVTSIKGGARVRTEVTPKKRRHLLQP